MEVTVSELLQGKATVIRNKDYLATKDFVQPFIDKMSAFTNDFRVKVKLPDQMTISETHDVTYNRVLIEAVLPKEQSIDNHDEVIGFLYGLDVRKPIAKVYRGYLNSACTNLTVFSPKWMTVQEVKPRESLEFDIQGLLELPNSFDQKVKLMKSTFIDRDTIHAKLGSWVDYTLRESWYNTIQNVRISPNVPIEAYKSLYINDQSPYFVPDTEEASVFQAYNAFTQIITDDSKDIINRFEKTMMINKLLGV